MNKTRGATKLLGYYQGEAVQSAPCTTMLATFSWLCCPHTTNHSHSLLHSTQCRDCRAHQYHQCNLFTNKYHNEPPQSPQLLHIYQQPHRHPHTPAQSTTWCDVPVHSYITARQRQYQGTMTLVRLKVQQQCVSIYVYRTVVTRGWKGNATELNNVERLRVHDEK